MMIATRNQVVSGSVESPGHDARPARVRRNKSRPVAPHTGGSGRLCDPRLARFVPWDNIGSV
jgi:hypothetical protein